jgi:hypothetical protein
MANEPAIQYDSRRSFSFDGQRDEEHILGTSAGSQRAGVVKLLSNYFIQLENTNAGPEPPARFSAKRSICYPRPQSHEMQRGHLATLTGGKIEEKQLPPVPAERNNRFSEWQHDDDVQWQSALKNDGPVPAAKERNFDGEIESHYNQINRRHARHSQSNSTSSCTSQENVSTARHSLNDEYRYSDVDQGFNPRVTTRKPQFNTWLEEASALLSNQQITTKINRCQLELFAEDGSNVSQLDDDHQVSKVSRASDTSLFEETHTVDIEEHDCDNADAEPLQHDTEAHEHRPQSLIQHVPTKFHVGDESTGSDTSDNSYEQLLAHQGQGTTIAARLSAAGDNYHQGTAVATATTVEVRGHHPCYAASLEHDDFDFSVQPPTPLDPRQDTHFPNEANYVENDFIATVKMDLDSDYSRRRGRRRVQGRSDWSNPFYEHGSSQRGAISPPSSFRSGSEYVDCSPIPSPEIESWNQGPGGHSYENQIHDDELLPPAMMPCQHHAEPRRYLDRSPSETTTSTSSSARTISTTSSETSGTYAYASYTERPHHEVYLPAPSPSAVFDPTASYGIPSPPTKETVNPYFNVAVSGMRFYEYYTDRPEEVREVRDGNRKGSGSASGAGAGRAPYTLVDRFRDRFGDL